MSTFNDRGNISVNLDSREVVVVWGNSWDEVRLTMSKAAAEQFAERVLRAAKALETAPDPEVEALVTQALHDIHDIEDPDWPDTIRRAVEAGRAPLLRRISGLETQLKLTPDARLRLEAMREKYRSDAKADGAREAYEDAVDLLGRPLARHEVVEVLRGRARGGSR